MNKKYFITGVLLILIGFSLLISKHINKNKFYNDDNKNVVEKCKNPKGGITGGSFNLYFETNSNEKLDSMNVCIACPPNSYLELPTAKKDGYTFDGWYYDKNFKNKFKGKTTLDIEPKVIYDKKCFIIGYKDIIFYAKWVKK